MFVWTCEYAWESIQPFDSKQKLQEIAGTMEVKDITTQSRAVHKEFQLAGGIHRLRHAL